MLSSLSFGSYLSYTPRPLTEDEKSAKQWMYAIKNDHRWVDPDTKQIRSTAGYLSGFVKSVLSSTELHRIFSEQSVLVPVPGSGLQQKGSLWVAERIASALVAAGVGAEVYPCLKRESAVQKSATARPGERPTVQQHFDSFKVHDGDFLRDASFVLIDDVVTRGATMLAAASRLAEAFPGGRVAGFAMLRTMGYHSPFKSYVDPTVGLITLNHYGQSNRNP